MSDISRAIAAKLVDIKKLQTDLEALRRAASILGSAGAGTKRSKRTRRRRKMSAAARKALSKKLKAFWAAKKKAKK